ncbi:glycosyltransferase family 4 protein [Pedobacter sp. B4-66]|uniref:glycosyltransferase family 4 protein n=1 Tax=Pedobacter sp. B4-66 TaxID=2817280 RepID=UPI001BD982F2|nr:glycosyltransferase family 4 protein [Pedobacter sp. B4-66]
MKLAIICTHPIQYYVPVFKLLAQKIELKVFYTAGKDKHFDKGFNQALNWDIPLFDGYLFEFLLNTAKEQGSHHFMGIKNPDATKHISSFAPNYILVYGWAYFSHLKILQHFKGKMPILFRGDSTLLNKQSIFKDLLKRIALKYVYSRIDKAFYVGANNKAYFRKYGLKEEQLIFAPHAVDNERFSRKSASDIRLQLHIQEQKILILFAGKFESIKNPELLLNAFTALNLLNVHLLYVGSGVLETKLRSIAVGYRNIHFMPFQNQSIMPTVYQACDLFCLPSNNDSWGLAVNEAMAAGKAILVSDKTGSAIDLVRELNGNIFQSGNLEDLKSKLLELVSNREQLRLKGKHSEEIISSWNFENQVKNILNAIAN